MSTSLRFRSVCKLTLVTNEEEGFTFVAMGFKITPTVLPGGGEGIAIRYIVNSPDRFEHRFTGRVVSATPTATVIERVTSPEDEEPPTYYRFEPLTLENWKTMEIWDSESMLKELPDDASLQNYYWNDWVPDYWLEGVEGDPV